MPLIKQSLIQAHKRTFGLLVINQHDVPFAHRGQWDGGMVGLGAPSASWGRVNNYRWTIYIHTQEKQPLTMVFLSFLSSLIRTCQPKHPSSVRLLTEQNPALCPPCLQDNHHSIPRSLCWLAWKIRDRTRLSLLPWYQRCFYMVWQSS